jgi:predicted dehydrogenase
VTIAVGIIGCGGIAEHHAKGYLAIPDEARVVAVSDVVEGNARRYV